MSDGQTTPPGWYHADGDPAGSTRWWDGTQWVGEAQFGGQPQAAAGAPGAQGVPGMEPPPGSWGQQAMGVPSLSEPMARIGGRVIDALIWLVIGFIVNLPIISQVVSESIEAADEGRDPVVEVSAGLIIITSLINLILIVAYEVFLNVRGGTPGKRAISARIVKDDGSALDTNTAFMRMVPYIVVQILGMFWSLAAEPGALGPSLPALIVAIAALVMLFTDSRRQTPWDKVAKTLVVSN